MVQRKYPCFGCDLLRHSPICILQYKKSEETILPTTPIYYYDAFISYRHGYPDEQYAIWLHEALEAYRLPKSLKKSGLSDIKRVFRDDSELAAIANMSAGLETALERSRYLIIICSPRLPKSNWCHAEIKKFRDMGRHNQILALLIEGEPSASFPPILTEIREQHIDDRGEVIERVRKVQPFAADVRPKAGHSHKEINSSALLKLVATIVGCQFDDLRQREWARRLQRMRYITATTLILLIVFSSIAAFAIHEMLRVKEVENHLRKDHALVSMERDLLLKSINSIITDVRKIAKEPGMERLAKRLLVESNHDIELIHQLDRMRTDESTTSK